MHECNTVNEDDFVAFMKKKMNNYISFQFVGGTDCHISISINKEKFSINHHGMKWLSNTPDVKSLLWNTNETKIIAYVNITDIRDKKNYWIFSSQLCKHNKNKLIVTTLISEIIKKISGSFNQDSSVIFMCDENYNNIDNHNEIISSLETNLSNMKNCVKNIYANLNKYKVRINGNILGYITSTSLPCVKDKTYGLNTTIMTKNMNKCICYTVILNNSVDNQPSSYLPIVLFASRKN